MTMAILTDISFIYALYNTKDALHQQAIDFALHQTEETRVPDVILPEISYLFLRDFGYTGVQTFLAHFSQLDIKWVPLAKSDLIRVNEIATKYARAEFDVVDCCIMAQAERLNITRVATFDRRDFSIFHPSHCDYLELLP